MADSYRRLLKRPAGVGGSDWSRLGRLLADAVRRQRQFADQSPHVLRFIGELTEHDQDTYFVEHEPASPMPLGGLFNPSAPAVHQSQLLRVTVALFDALRSAHTGQEPHPIAHGGVCPGVVLFAPDGAAKLTDFGFAGALCEVLGTDSYVNLAVGPPESDPGDVHLTGAWEVLAPDRFDRDDRICAFIDPEKYGTHALGAFEPGSDVIAAGFVLHLLAEHQHPYLHADPDAHRLVEMSEYMAMGRYNQARRQDLRESTDPGVRLWCDLIARTLARLPQNRPTAGAVADALAQHVKPEDAADNLRRQLDALQGLADGQAWDELSEAARTIAASRGAPPDVVERANALTVVAQANLLLAQARETLAGSDWPAAREPADQVLAMPGLPADLAHQAREVADSVEANLAAQAVLSQVKSRLEQDDGSDPIATVELMQALLAELDRIAADRPLLPPLRLLQATVRNTVADALEAARPAAESAKDADRARADQWLVQLDSALADERWDDLEQGLADRPQLRSWPEEAAARAQAVQQALDDHRAGEKRQAAIEADRQAAQGWIERLRQATEAQEWTAAEQVLGDKPRLTHWPQEVLDEANRLAARLRAVARKEADEEQARHWCA